MLRPSGILEAVDGVDGDPRREVLSQHGEDFLQVDDCTSGFRHSPLKKGPRRYVASTDVTPRSPAKLCRSHVQPLAAAESQQLACTETEATGWHVGRA